MTRGRFTVAADLVGHHQVAGPEIVAEGTGHTRDEQRPSAVSPDLAVGGTACAHQFGRDPPAEGKPLRQQRGAHDSGHRALRST